MRKKYLLSRGSAFLKTVFASVVLFGGYANAHADCRSVVDEDHGYYMGTNFNPADTIVKSFDDLASFFTDYGIVLSEGNIKTYSIGRDVESFFGQIPALDVENGTAGWNYYMFIDGPINGSLFQLKFPAYESAGKTYMFKMRAYIQLDGQCSDSAAWSDAKIRVRTQHNPIGDKVEVNAYNDKTSELLGSKTADAAKEESLYLKDIIGIDSLTSQDLIRLEFTFSGRFPETVSGLEYFVVSPVLEQFMCTKMAIDFVGSGNEYETVCIDDYVGCEGETTTIHATGFPRDAKIEWFKQDADSSWIAVGNETELAITVESKSTYMLRATTENVQVVEIVFNVIGKICTDVDDVNATEADAIVDVYSVDGAILKSKVKYSEALIGLKKGYYIVGDKKVYISE